MSAPEDTENPIGSGVIESDAPCRCFSLAEMQSATDNFNDAFVIGTGGFGNVYKGFIIDDDGTTVVAIKRSNSKSKQGADQFSAEIKTLSNLRHTNLVALIGYCSEYEEKILVYEYIARGTLADHLYKTSEKESSAISSPLSWEQRLEICVGAARGLNYIHSGTNQSFIHRDVKPANILLDEDWVVKISDFGLSKGTTSHSVTHFTTQIKGTFGYFDPDYFVTQRLTMKSDVYAFGVVLLEILCGRRPVDRRLEDEQIILVNWAKKCIEKRNLDRVIDPSLSGQISSRSLNLFVKVANNCLQNSPKERPTMAEVVESLELALAQQRKVRTEGIITKLFQGIPLVLKGIDQYWSRKVPRTPKNAGSNAGHEAQNMSALDGTENAIASAVPLCTGHEAQNMSALDGTENAIASAVIESDASCRCFSLVEIQSATNDFDDEFVIGVTGFGMVYKGFITHDDGTIVVAIKRWNSESKQGANEFLAEIKILSNLRHANLVALIGYCSDSEEKILIYEYIARGTLADHLYKRHQGENSDHSSHLSWVQRLEICVGAARGLDYFHRGTNQSFIHRDVTITNILLDENWVVKISNIGLSQGTASHSITHVTTMVKGTFGYLDPDYFLTQRLTKKSDVYSFGVVLLEILCGRPPVNPSLEEEQISLVKWAQQCIKKGKLDRVIDPSLSGQMSSRSLNLFVKVANNCLQIGPKARPTMAEVVESLELALASQRKVRTEGIITKLFQGIPLVPKGLNQ